MEAEDDEEVNDGSDKSKEFKTTWGWSSGDGEGEGDEAEEDEESTATTEANDNPRVISLSFHRCTRFSGVHEKTLDREIRRDEEGGGDEQDLPQISSVRWDKRDEEGGAAGGGGGGAGDEQILQISRLQQHAISETSYNR